MRAQDLIEDIPEDDDAPLQQNMRSTSGKIEPANGKAGADFEGNYSSHNHKSTFKETWLSWNSESLENATRILQRVAFVVAGIFVFVQWMEEQQTQREYAAMELVRVWESPEYQESYSNISSAISEAIDQLEGFESGLLSEAATLELRSRIGIASLSSETYPNVRADVNKLIYFGGRIGYCISRDMCDDKTLKAYFHDLYRSIVIYYRGYIESVREQENATFGEFLDVFVGSEKAATARMPITRN